MASGPAARGNPLQMRYRSILGRNVARFRQARGLTQKAVASRTAVSQDWICLIEQGRVNPTLDVIVELAWALNVTPAELILPSDK